MIRLLLIIAYGNTCTGERSQKPSLETNLHQKLQLTASVSLANFHWML